MLQYMLSDSKESQKLARQKFLYMEDRRRYEFNGTSKRKGRCCSVNHFLELIVCCAGHPRLVQAVSKQCNLIPRLSSAKMAKLIREQYAIPENQRKSVHVLDRLLAYAYPYHDRRTRMLMNEKLTAGQRNSLATGNSLMQDKRRQGLVRVVVRSLP